MRIIAMILIVTTATIFGDDSVMRECAEVIFPSGNIPATIVKRNSEGVSLYTTGQPQQFGEDYFRYSREDGVTNFEEIQTLNPSPDVLAAASNYKAVMGMRFGDGAHTNTLITEQYVTAYFIQRRASGDADITDASDALMMQSFYQSMRSITIDGTAWSFPWGMVP